MTPFLKICFEALFAGGCIGLALILFRSRDRKIWGVAIAILLMMLGRIWFGGSSRYSIVMILPLICLAVMGCRLVPETLADLFPTVFRRYRVAICRFLFLALFFACIGKVLHVNRYADFLIRASQAVREDAVAYRAPLMLNFNSDASRLEYYSGVPAIACDYRGEEVTMWELEDRLESWSYFHDVLYLSRNISGREIPPETWKIGDRELTKVFSGYRNNRRSRQIVVYRYPVPSGQAVDRNNAADSLIPNYGFEEKGSSFLDEELVRRGLILRQALPVGWLPNPGQGYRAGGKMELGLDENAIAGKYSLRMKSDTPMTLMTDRMFSCQENYALQLLYRGEPGSRFHIMVYLYQANGTFERYRTESVFTVQGDGVAPFQMRLTFPPEEYQFQFRVVLTLQEGDVSFDQIRLTPWSVEL